MVPVRVPSYPNRVTGSRFLKFKFFFELSMALGKRKGKGVTRNGHKRRRTPARRPKGTNARTGGFLGIENKFIDYSFSGDVVGTNDSAEVDPATANSLSAMAIGDGESNRDGRKAVLTSIHVKGSMEYKAETNETVMPSARVAFIALLMDTQTNGAQFNSEDVYLPATNVEFAWRNLQFTKRFKVIRTQQFVFDAPNAAFEGVSTFATGGMMQTFQWDVPLQTAVQMGGSTAVVANIIDNSIHMLAFASNGNVFSLKYESRCRFIG